MSENTVKNTEKEFPNVANEDWGMLSELSNNHRFVVKAKKSDVNIETLSTKLKTISETDDHAVETQNQVDEKSMGIERRVAPSIIEEKVVKSVEAPQVEQIVQQTVVEEEVTKIKAVSNVKTKTYSQFNALFKLAALGLAHLYVKKTTRLLNPLRFVADNFSQVLMAILHLTVPLAMTWYLTKKVPFITMQMAQMTPVMTIVCSLIFYFACIFVWISFQAIVSGLGAVVKRTLEDAAKVGQEKN